MSGGDLQVSGSNALDLATSNSGITNSSGTTVRLVNEGLIVDGTSEFIGAISNTKGDVTVSDNLDVDGSNTLGFGSTSNQPTMSRGNDFNIAVAGNFTITETTPNTQNYNMTVANFTGVSSGGAVGDGFKVGLGFAAETATNDNVRGLGTFGVNMTESTEGNIGTQFVWELLDDIRGDVVPQEVMVLNSTGLLILGNGAHSEDDSDQGLVPKFGGGLAINGVDVTLTASSTLKLNMTAGLIYLNLSDGSDTTANGLALNFTDGRQEGQIVTVYNLDENSSNSDKFVVCASESDCSGDNVRASQGNISSQDGRLECGINQSITFLWDDEAWVQIATTCELDAGGLQ